MDEVVQILGPSVRTCKFRGRSRVDLYRSWTGLWSGQWVLACEGRFIIMVVVVDPHRFRSRDDLDADGGLVPRLGMKCTLFFPISRTPQPHRINEVGILLIRPCSSR